MKYAVLKKTETDHQVIVTEDDGTTWTPMSTAAISNLPLIVEALNQWETKLENELEAR